MLLALPAAVRAEESPEELFRQGKWAESAAAFKKSAGPDLDARPQGLWSLYNLGTALAKSGAAPEAYAVFLKAYFQNPLDGDLNHNLAFVEKRLSPAAGSVRPSTWIRWWPDFFRAFSFSTWLLISMLALALGLWLAGSGSHASTKITAFVCTGLFLAMGALGWWQSRYPVAAVIAQSKMRSGPEISFQEITTLEPGALINVEETRDHWHKVRFQTQNSQETVGWIESATALRILP